MLHFHTYLAIFKQSSYKSDMALHTYEHDWKNLHNWYNASKAGFPMYRVTNDTFMDNVLEGNVIYIIFINFVFFRFSVRTNI